MNSASLHWGIFLLWGYQLLPLSYVLAQCQIDDPFLQRVGKTRFFILHNKTKRGDYTTWEDGKTGCMVQGLKLAKVDSIGTDVLIGRHLEQLTRQNRWLDTWYWINAKFDKGKEVYVWQDEERQPLQYTNFFYRQPRPTGVAGFITWYGSYDRKKEVEQCIAITLPWPIDKNYGFQTSWDEKPCISEQKRHALCEAEAECDEEGLDPKQIFTEGITTYHFWTNLKFIWNKRHFVYPNGTVLDKGMYTIKLEESRTSKLADEFCVTIAYAYEYPNETAACDTCSWSMLVVAPANCNNPVGTICQHKDAASRKCIWKKQYLTNITKAEIDTATVEFGITDPSAPKDKGSVFRSTYKQQFGDRFCPPKTKMVRATNEDWHKIPEKAGLELSSTGITISNPQDNVMAYAYDYDESYWVVDEDEFDKIGKKCTLSVLQNGKRENKQVDCDEWHFYLCENITLSQPESNVPSIPSDMMTTTTDASTPNGDADKQKGQTKPRKKNKQDTMNQGKK
ncbi:unnamed protein product [Orchesella dallaii]|uniref:C-type lectin domain-containing protein n=1 Tax=Orchesella dallaii TaxID=48710 RepID=A0ABP1PSM3_9HEXA